MSGGWQGSTRRSRLPKDWPARVLAVKTRANNRCEAKQHATGCDGFGRECDHVERGDHHDLSNLQWLSTACHKAKTQAEKPRRVRPERRHPSA